MSNSVHERGLNPNVLNEIAVLVTYILIRDIFRYNSGFELAAGGSVRQADAKRGDLVAPLLREVAAEVERFVASGGWTRMPTRPELMSAGVQLSKSALGCP